MRKYLKAISDSIDVWNYKLMLILSGEANVIDFRAHECPLCQFSLFNCVECPIVKQFGDDKYECRNTPYVSVVKYLTNKRDPEMAVRAAVREIRFLEKLYEKAAKSLI